MILSYTFLIRTRIKKESPQKERLFFFSITKK